MIPDLHRDLAAIVGDAHVVSDPAQLARLSRDYSWFSPLLDEPMRRHSAELAVAPGRTEELVRVLELVAEKGVPVTVRGGGTGNYGQAVPLEGGLLLLTHRLDRVLEITPENVRLEPGARLGDVTRALAKENVDLRLLPSTYLTSAVGGFVAGGTGGIGSITWGTLREGNITSLTVQSVTSPSVAERVVGDDLNAYVHTYGTAGVISEVVLPVQPLLPWSEAVYSFPTLAAALEFGLSTLDLDLPKRLMSLQEWPIPSYFDLLVKLGAIHHGRVSVLVEAVEASGPAFLAAARTAGGMLTWAAPPEAYHRSPVGVSNFAFNHTTLVGKLADPSLTYLQVGFPPEKLVEAVAYIREQYPHDIAFHVEIMRMRGALFAATLPLFSFRGEDELHRLMAIFAEAGGHVINPHTHLLDTAKAHAELVPTKRRNDPADLLNPGKLTTAVAH
jgi:FAD/FMN-containing dehydrogenases